MDEKQLLEIGAWLNTLGYDIDLTDDFWMEEERWDEHKTRDVAELLEDYHQYKLKLLDIPDVSNSAGLQREPSVCGHIFMPIGNGVVTTDTEGCIYCGLERKIAN